MYAFYYENTFSHMCTVAICYNHSSTPSIVYTVSQYIQQNIQVNSSCIITKLN